MKSKCYFQKLIGGDVEAIVQVSDDKEGGKMKVVLTKQFTNTLDAQRWWRESRDAIKIAAGRIPR